MCRNQVLLQIPGIVANNSRCKQNKKNPAQDFVDIDK